MSNTRAKNGFYYVSHCFYLNPVYHAEVRASFMYLYVGLLRHDKTRLYCLVLKKNEKFCKCLLTKLETANQEERPKHTKSTLNDIFQQDRFKNSRINVFLGSLKRPTEFIFRGAHRRHPNPLEARVAVGYQCVLNKRGRSHDLDIAR